MVETLVVGQENILEQLKLISSGDRIAHSYLFTSEEGAGALSISIHFAKALLCSGANNANCLLKVNSLSHPDLHFVFPTNTNNEIKKNSISDNFISQWREAVLDNPYLNLYEWSEKIGISNKQANISVHEAKSINKKMSLKSFEGGYRVMIIWMAEKMNIDCANKLLKLIEEPSPKTVFILITENENTILPTIRSRCQKINLSPIQTKSIAQSLVLNNIADEGLANKIATLCMGNYNQALKMSSVNQENLEFESLFIEWVRLAFKAKTQKSAVSSILIWSEKISKLPKEKQKKFLGFATETFRQAVLYNYSSLKTLNIFGASDFKFENFAPFIHNNNILEIFEELDSALKHLERNGNAKIIITDLSIKLTRLIHKKASEV